jgi:hypothetical protein
MWTGALCRGVALDTHLYLGPKLKMSTSTLFPSFCACMTCYVEIFNFTLDGGLDHHKPTSPTNNKNILWDGTSPLCFQLLIYFVKLVMYNVQEKIKQGTCFGWSSHHQAFFENIKNMLNTAIGARSPHFKCNNTL